MMLLCPTFILKYWRSEVNSCVSEANTNTESYLRGRIYFFRIKQPGMRHRSASDLKHQCELTRQAGHNAHLLLYKHQCMIQDFGEGPYLSSHPLLPLQFDLSLPFLLPQCRTKTSCESNKPLIDHKALSGDRLGLLKISGMLPGAGSLSPEQIGALGFGGGAEKPH